jgi:hypothetical protein
VAVEEAVEVADAVAVCVAVGGSTSVGVDVAVGVGVKVAVAVGARVGLGVEVGMDVDVAVAVAVDVAVDVDVAVEVGVGVEVAVAVDVDVAVAVGGGAGTRTVSAGALADVVNVCASTVWHVTALLALITNSAGCAAVDATVTRTVAPNVCVCSCAGIVGWYCQLVGSNTALMSGCGLETAAVALTSTTSNVVICRLSENVKDSPGSRVTLVGPMALNDAKHSPMVPAEAAGGRRFAPDATINPATSASTATMQTR